MNRLQGFFFWLLLFCCFALTGFGQTDEYPEFNAADYPSKRYSIKRDTFTFHQATIYLIQVKLRNARDYDANSTFCRIWLTVKKGDKIKEKLYYKDCEAVGGCSGIFASPLQPVRNYFILSKFGDYDGRIILIDSLGEVRSYPGGDYYLTAEKRYLFSIYNSDLAGLTVFDLNKNKLLFCSDSLSTYLAGFYVKNDQYFFKVENDAIKDDKVEIATYNFKHNRLDNLIVGQEFLSNSTRIPGYNVFRFGPCNCGRTVGEKSEMRPVNLILTQSNISLLQGAWGNDAHANATFGIYGDSIYYPDPDLWCKYSIHADTLVIYPDQKTEDKVLVTKITADSLIVKYLNANELIRFSKKHQLKK